MINEAEYQRYWKDRIEGEAKAKELFKTLKECQKEFNWPQFKDDNMLFSYARVKGLLSRDELLILRNYLY